MQPEPPPYDPNIPANPSDALATSQPQFLNNFQKLYEAFEVNHIPLDALSGAGNHTIVQLLEQENPQQTQFSEISVYTKDVSDQTDQVFLRYQGDGTEFQLTNYQIYSVDATTFFTFLPGKIIVYFGSFITLPSNVLKLFPPVAKKIMGMTFCPSGSTPTNKPRINLLQPSSGFFTGMEVFATPGFGRASPPCYYTILANF